MAGGLTRAARGAALIDHAWIPLWLGASLLAIFATGLMPLYSTRTLGVAWEMWSSGQFIVPYSNGEPYSHKVPLLFWLIHVGWTVTGVGDGWPRVLEVLTGLAVLLFAQRLARVLWRDEPGVARLTPWLLAAFSYAFLFALQIMYEMLLCACVLAAMNALVSRDLAKRPAFAWFAVAVAAGLMTKGPVMLLHVAFPFLLGPWWHPWARRHRGHWYAAGGLALLAAVGVLLAWAFAAGQAGGEAYRNELFFMQTTGRMVDSFDHARPWWWYASVLPMLALPWILWPRAWQATVIALRSGGSPGLRFVTCWLLPVGIAFSLVSGKQAYYLLPEAAAAAMLLAAGFARLGARGRIAPRLASAWPLAAALAAGAVALWQLPRWVAQGRVESVWYIDLAGASPGFAFAGLVLAACAVLPARNDASAVRRVSTASILAVTLVYVLFSQTLWPRFDLRPAARHLAGLEAAGVPVAHLDIYQNQFRFLGRLTKPITAFLPHEGDDWAAAHPDGRVIRYVPTLAAEDVRHAELVQPFRSDWLIIERADGWLARRRGETEPPAATPAQLYPPDYWPYRAFETAPAR